jgi:hypothetical protein
MTWFRAFNSRVEKSEMARVSQRVSQPLSPFRTTKAKPAQVVGLTRDELEAGVGIGPLMLVFNTFLAELLSNFK